MWLTISEIPTFIFRQFVDYKSTIFMSPDGGREEMHIDFELSVCPDKHLGIRGRNI